MKTLFALGIVLISSCLWAEDKVVIPDVKLGLWENTVTHQMSGMPPIPPDALARLTPEQRARMEAAMKARSNGQPTTSTSKSCMTKEKLEKGATFAEERKECTHSVTNSSRTKADIKFECTEEQMKVSGTIHYEVVDSEHVKGTTDMVMSGNGHTMNSTSTFTSKWVSANCGDVD